MVHLLERYSNAYINRGQIEACLALRGREPIPRARSASRKLADRLSDEDFDAIVNDYTERRGTISELAEAHGCSEYAIRQVLRRGGVTPNPRVSPEQIARVRELWPTGVTKTAIADKVGVSRATVRAIVEGLDTSPLATRAMDELATMTELREKGWSYREIGNRFGVSGQAVFQRLSRQANMSDPA